MNRVTCRVLAAALMLAVVPAVVLGAPDATDARRDILVTHGLHG